MYCSKHFISVTHKKKSLPLKMSHNIVCHPKFVSTSNHTVFLIFPLSFLSVPMLNMKFLAVVER